MFHIIKNRCQNVVRPFSKVLQPQPFALFCSNLAVEVGSSHEVLPALAKKLGAHTIIAEDEVEHVWRKVSRWPPPRPSGPVLIF
jgi:hypothetical protein